ncbi:hypothetical protein JL720_2042 [Aureococcus anophagefferens]|nr:hypothetical protein JL720_2042 [Aureococcus anophagefferens]
MDTLVALWRAAARTHGAAPLLRFEGRADVLTYGDVDARCRALAAQLVACGAGGGRGVLAVALCGGRDGWDVVALLACVVARAPWCPCDAAGAAVADDGGVADAAAWPADALYILRTSGSSGAPKAVVGSAAATAHRLKWQWTAFPWRPGEAALRRTPCVFVDSVAEMLGAALGGAALYVPATNDLVAAAAAGRCGRLLATPSLLAAFLRVVDGAGGLAARLPDLALVVASGEALPPWLVAAFRASAKGRAKLVNVWGSTECAADACFADVTDHETGDVPVGAPLDGGVDVALEGGELVVRGAALALGYAGPGGTLVDGGAFGADDRGRFADWRPRPPLPGHGGPLLPRPPRRRRPGRPPRRDRLARATRVGRRRRPEGGADAWLAALFDELLPVVAARDDDDFFARGGTSLLAIEACWRANRAFGAELQPRDLAAPWRTSRGASPRAGRGATAGGTAGGGGGGGDARRTSPRRRADPRIWARCASGDPAPRSGPRAAAADQNVRYGLARRWVFPRRSARRRAAAEAGDRRVCYVASHARVLYALDVDGGEQLWASAVRDGGEPAAAALEAGAAVGAALRRVLRRCGLRRRPRHGRRRLDVPRRARARQERARRPRSRVVYGSHDGRARALDAADGAVAWAAELDAAVFASPAVGFGRVFVATLAGSAYALRDSDGAAAWRRRGGPAPSTRRRPSSATRSSSRPSTARSPRST